MSMIKVKGYEFEAFKIKGPANRRAIQFQNNILKTLRRLGLTEDDVEIKEERVAIKKAPASVKWWMESEALYFSYKSANSFIENLYIISKVLEFEVDSLLNKEKTMDEFLAEFVEDEDVEKQRKEARDLLGVDHNSLDIEHIDKQYKLLAKEHHPDVDGGSIDKFKAINKAHKILRKELY